MHAVRNLVLTTVAALVASGCLADTRSGRMDTSDTADTGDTVDTSDTTNRCSDVQCDEVCGAFCDPATGQCVEPEQAAAEFAQPTPECFEDADCDDGDPCTPDACIDERDECGYGRVYCVSYDVQELCDLCADTDACDDGDPCTADGCDPFTGQCTATSIPGCRTNGCSGGNITPHADITNGDYMGRPVTVAGTLRASAYGACDDGPQNRCRYDTVLRDGGRTLSLYDSDAPGELWQCTSAGIDFVSEGCSPAHEGGAYWVWGTAQFGGYQPEPAGASGDVPSVPLPASDSVAVESFCLQTNAAGLVGAYAVSVTAWGVTQEFGAEIFLTPEGRLRWSVDLDSCLCDGGTVDCVCDMVSAHTSAIELGDGDIRVALRGTFNATSQPFDVDIQLFSNRNTLSGVTSPAWGSGGGEPPADRDGAGAVAPLEISVQARKNP
ncbi:MAG: hypothetical protein ACI9MR_001474 [Myxococcota bacterium]|jgi:hypothetical protein